MSDDSKKKDSYANWKNLPTEIIHKSFQQETKTQLDELTHVCKAWTKTVQAILYADIKITSPSQFSRFCNTVKQHSYLGSYVKKLELFLRLDELGEPGYTAVREEVLNQLNQLLPHLPNLREYKEDSLRTFEPILKALLNSQLKHLKKLNTPHMGIVKSEIPNYVACAILMKNRLENIALSHYMDYDSSLTTLKKDLALYEKVKEVEVEFSERTNEILELEQIVETCKSLESIKYSFYPKSTATPGAPADTISTYVPDSNIKKLTSSTIFREQTILLYIMHKFPKLQNLTLELDFNNAVEIDQNVLDRLFDYMKNLRYFLISRIQVNQDTLTTLIGNYWDAISKPGYETLRIFDPDHGNSEQLTKLNLEKTKDATNPITTLVFSDRRARRDYVDFIEKNGKFIGELQFGYPMMKFLRSTLCDVPENVIADTFKYCSNLRILRMEQCALEKSSFARMDMTQSRSMDEIYLKNCSVYSGMLEQCSLVLPELKRLRLCGIKFFFSDELPFEPRGYPTVDYPNEVIMPYTKIDTVILEDIEPNEPVYIKLYVMSQKMYYYYRVDAAEDLLAKESNDEDYTAENEDTHFYICCQSKPEFQFEIIE